MYKLITNYMFLKTLVSAICFKLFDQQKFSNFGKCTVSGAKNTKIWSSSNRLLFFELIRTQQL